MNESKVFDAMKILTQSHCYESHVNWGLDGVSECEHISLGLPDTVLGRLHSSSHFQQYSRLNARFFETPQAL